MCSQSIVIQGEGNPGLVYQHEGISRGGLAVLHDTCRCYSRVKKREDNDDPGDDRKNQQEDPFRLHGLFTRSLVKGNAHLYLLSISPLMGNEPDAFCRDLPVCSVEVSCGEDRSSAGVESGEVGVPESYTGQFLKPMLEGKTKIWLCRNPNLKQSCTDDQKI